MLAMNIDLIFPAHPPALDGIGDYTARLAETLAARHEVRFLTAQSDPDPIPGVTSLSAFALSPRHRTFDIVDAASARQPDAVVLQYNPFSYGRWGFNLHLPVALRRLKEACPDTTVVVMVHEPFVPVENLSFAVMTVWQRLQLWRLGRTADVVAFSIMPWTQRFESWFPSARVLHLPVGSNMPNVELPREEARRRLGLDDDPFVIGVFGSAHESRLLPFIRRATSAVDAQKPDVRVLYVGPDGDDVQRVLDERTSILDAGPLPADEVSRHLSACDLYLAPFDRGVSTRRGSFMVGLQHGIATISTHGSHTDPMLHRANEDAFVLAPDDAPEAFARHAMRLAASDRERHRLARTGADYFEKHFAWPRIARRLTDALPADEVTSPQPAASA